MKKSLRLMTIVLLMSQILVSCGAESRGEATGPADTSSGDESTAEVETSILDSLPERDYGGAEYNILAPIKECYGDTKFYVEEMTGDKLSDAVYKRNKDVEDMYNIKFSYDVVNGYSAGMKDVHTKLTGSVLAGDCTYDMFVGSSAYVSSLILEKLFADMNSDKNFDFDGAWWHKLGNDSMMVNDHLYIASGFYGFVTLSESWCIFLNKGLVEDLNIESPYTYVYDGTWTFDEMMEMAKSAVLDLNGDSKFDKNDRYGIIMTDTEATAPLSYGMGRLVTENDENGIPKLTDATERTLNIMENLNTLLENKDHVMYSAQLQPDKELIPMFNNKQALFAMYPMHIVELQEMRQAPDFGILPLPKYDEKQENYITQAWPCITAIPALVKDQDMSSAVLEALNRVTYLDVYPIYKEIILQRKLARDNESSEAVDIIGSNALCDFGTIFRIEDKLIWPQEICGNYSSWWASNKEQLTIKLEKIIETINQLDS